MQSNDAQKLFKEKERLKETKAALQWGAAMARRRRKHQRYRKLWLKVGLAMICKRLLKASGKLLLLKQIEQKAHRDVANVTRAASVLRTRMSFRHNGALGDLTATLKR